MTQRERGVSRKFVGVEIHARRIARKGCDIIAGGERVGTVTSGTFAPFLQSSLAMGYVRADLAAPGVKVSVDVPGCPVEASIVRIPFLRGREKPAAAGKTQQ